MALSNIKRREELDYAKGFAILLLILSHSIIGDNMLKTWIFSFHMPVFFIICGILHGMKNPEGIPCNKIKTFLYHRCKQLLIPYFFWGSILILFFQLLNLVSGQQFTLGKQIFKLFTMQGIESMWFIPCYMVAEFFFVFIYSKFSKTIRMVGIIVIILLIAYMQLKGIPDIWYIHLILKIIIGVVFIYIGFLVEKYCIISKVHISIAVIGMILGAILALENGFVGIGALQMQNVFLFF